MEISPVVYVVDDDSSVRKSLERQIRSAGFEVKSFPSAEEFLSHPDTGRPGCLILDLKMPGMGGLELQEQLTAAKRVIPIIFITGYGTVQTCAHAMKEGALDFLEKPFDDAALLTLINKAIMIDLQTRENREYTIELRRRWDILTYRERQVFGLVAAGKLNKEIAYELGITEKTIKVHRARVMQKMKASSLADLVRMAEKLTIASTTNR